jgi:VanZ family protein
MLRNLNFRFLAWSYMLFLFLGAVLPINGGRILSDNYTFHIRWDYLLHFLIYLPLPVLMLLAYRKYSRVWIYVLLFIGTLGITILFEYLQTWLPYRSFNINDMIANGLGVMIGFAVIFFLPRSWRSGLQVP